jgi:hypothetical protein
LPTRPTDSARLRVAGGDAAGDRVVDRVGDLVEVAVLDAPLRAPRVDLDAQRHATVHRDRERLRAAHAAEAGGERDRAGELPPNLRRAISAKHS